MDMNASAWTSPKRFSPQTSTREKATRKPCISCCRLPHERTSRVHGDTVGENQFASIMLCGWCGYNRQ